MNKVISAYSPNKQVSVVLYYPSLWIAKKYNKGLTNFCYISSEYRKRK